MVKLLVLLKRKPGMAVEDFQRYWRVRHPDVVVRLPGLRRYVQSHTRPGGYRKGEPAYDGVAEVWFDSTDAMRALAGTPELAAVRADEANFLDVANSPFIITDDYVIREGPIPVDAVKSFGLARRKPGLAVEDFRRHWRDVHGPLGAQSPFVRRLVQSHTQRSIYEAGRTPPWDGAAIAWFDSSDAVLAWAASEDFARLLADEPNFIAPGRGPFILTTEHVIVA